MKQYTAGDTVRITNKKEAGRLAGRKVRLLYPSNSFWVVEVVGGAPGKGAPIGTKAQVKELYFTTVNDP